MSHCDTTHTHAILHYDVRNTRTSTLNRCVCACMYYVHTMYTYYVCVVYVHTLVCQTARCHSLCEHLWREEKFMALHLFDLVAQSDAFSAECVHARVHRWGRQRTWRRAPLDVIAAVIAYRLQKRAANSQNVSGKLIPYQTDNRENGSITPQQAPL